MSSRVQRFGMLGKAAAIAAPSSPRRYATDELVAAAGIERFDQYDRLWSASNTVVAAVVPVALLPRGMLRR